MSCELKPGDVFCTRGNMGAVSALIRGVEKFWSSDNEATYGHSGIITSSEGNTLEVLWTVREGSLSAYNGDEVIIARPVFKVNSKELITDDEKLAAINEMRKSLGRVYPVWRLPMFLFPPLAKYLSLGRWLACSEFTDKYLVLTEAAGMPYAGVNPDTLADGFRQHWVYEMVFEGSWCEYKIQSLCRGTE